MKCAQHGRSGISLVCRHVRAAVDAGSKLQPVEIVLVDWGESVITEMTYCTACIDGASPTRSPARIVADDLERLPAAAQPQPTCGKCLADWRDASA